MRKLEVLQQSIEVPDTLIDGTRPQIFSRRENGRRGAVFMPSRLPQAQRAVMRQPAANALKIRTPPGRSLFVGNYPALASSVKRKTVPPAGLDSALMCPPWASTIVRQIDSPTPIPSSFVVTNG